jgi:hypothetical protein
MHPWILTQPLKLVDVSMDSELEGIHEDGYMVRERKCGEFNRTLVIPPDTTAPFPSHPTVLLGLTHLTFAD